MEAVEGKIRKQGMAELKTPCYIIDEGRLKKNLEILSQLEKETGCKVLLAQKAFSCFYEYPLIGSYISGTTASGLYEARLGREEMNKENHVFSPAYREEDIEELVGLCDHMIFNSFSQLEKYKEQCRGVSVGLRINPECSTQEGHAIYDPCAFGSRLGIRAEQFPEILPEQVEGLHFHTLCEQDADALAVTLTAVEEKFGRWLPGLKWLNFGGGHHITRKGYDLELLKSCIRRMQEAYGLEIYLEPGEAVALNAGYLATTVLDVVENGITTLILDASAACHMPDVIEMPYTPPLYGAAGVGEKEYTYRLGGPTCLSGDQIGIYSFSHKLQEKDILLFGDMAIYTTCKNNTFNGMPLPAVWKRDMEKRMVKLKEFGYEDFKMRLGSKSR